jgi:pimeloyl-ACP methyl ester carboxylesterase
MPYADVNGLSMYYAEQGAGDALVLVHGGLGSGEMFAPILPDLAKARRVITLDLQANGRTADVNRPLRWETLADDLAAFIDKLGLVRPDVLGYSLGGGVALRFAIEHPGAFRRLVLLATPYARIGWFPEILAGFDAMGAGLADFVGPVRGWYIAIAPRPEDFPVLLEKTGDLLRQPYDWSADVENIDAPVMLGYADADSIRPEHVVKFYELLGGGRRDGHWDGSLRPAARLAVLPGQVHTDVLMSPGLAEAITRFLDERTLIPPSLELPSASPPAGLTVDPLPEQVGLTDVPAAPGGRRARGGWR